MKKTFLLAVALLMATPSVSLAQVISGSGSDSSSTSTSASHGTGIARSGDVDNDVGQSVNIDNSTTAPAPRIPVAGATVFTPSSSELCATTSGGGLSLSHVGAAINIATVVQGCEARADSQSMLSVAAAANAVGDQQGANVDVRAARIRLRESGDANRSAYAEAMGGSPEGPQQ